MSDVIEKVTNEVKEVIVSKKLINKKDKIIVGVSGGPDSMCLLDVLVEIKKELNLDYELIVAHVNHMIRDEAQNDKNYVESICKKYNLEFNYCQVDVKSFAKNKKMSEEMAGREIRYKFFNDLLKEKKASKIAVAHNLDDNVETIFLNLIRGTGLKGLIGMQYSSNNIIRPLLNTKKCDIVLYNNEKKLNPCLDKTNNETIYLRNKIRNILIPELKNEYNSNIVQNIIRMTKILDLENDFLDEYTNKVLEKSIISQKSDVIEFDFKVFMNEHDAIRKRCIRSILERLNLLEGMQYKNIDEILLLLSKNIKGKKYIKKGKFKIIILKKNMAKIFVGEEV